MTSRKFRLLLVDEQTRTNVGDKRTNKTNKTNKLNPRATRRKGETPSRHARDTQASHRIYPLHATRQNQRSPLATRDNKLGFTISAPSRHAKRPPKTIATREGKPSDRCVGCIAPREEPQANSSRHANRPDCEFIN